MLPLCTFMLFMSLATSSKPMVKPLARRGATSIDALGAVKFEGFTGGKNGVGDNGELSNTVSTIDYEPMSGDCLAKSPISSSMDGSYTDAHLHEAHLNHDGFGSHAANDKFVRSDGWMPPEACMPFINSWKYFDTPGITGCYERCTNQHGCDAVCDGTGNGVTPTQFAKCERCDIFPTPAPTNPPLPICLAKSVESSSMDGTYHDDHVPAAGEAYKHFLRSDGWLPPVECMPRIWSWKYFGEEGISGCFERCTYQHGCDAVCDGTGYGVTARLWKKCERCSPIQTTTTSAAPVIMDAFGNEDDDYTAT